MLAQWYPPCQAWPTAATRARLLATSLPDHGWRTVVLVPDMTAGACRCGWCADPDRPPPADPPGTTVHRLPVRPSRIRQLAALAARGRGTSTAAPPSSVTGSRRALSEAVWQLGDAHSNWAPVAEEAAGRLLARGGIDAVWTTSAPFAHVHLGHRLAEHYGVPWVADIRDPVSTDVTASGLLAKAVKARRAVYRRPLQAATAITAATGQVAAVDGPWLGREPVVLVPGFDDAEWATARAHGRPDPERFEVVFTGKLYETYRRPDVFLRGLRMAAERLGPDGAARLRFVYYGRSGAFLQTLAAGAGCAGLVEDRGFVDPTAVPALSAGAGALLLLTNDAGDSGVPGGKFFEYLAAHRPVLAVPGGDRYVGSVLSRTGAGRVADDERQVAEVLVDWFTTWRATGSLHFDGDVSAIEEFSAARSAARLADLLTGVPAPVSEGQPA